MRFKRLLNDHVLVKMEPAQEKSKGGIITSLHAPPVRIGKVLDVGPGKYYTDKYLPTEVRVGERVVFLVGSVDTKSGQAVAKHLSEDQVLIREPDILFVTEDSNLEVTL